MELTNIVRPSAVKHIRKIDDRYILFNNLVIGKGSFGRVVYGHIQEGPDTGKEVCFKVERALQNKSSMLKEEHKIYQQLSKIDGIPKIYHIGNYKNYNFVVMDLLGPSLDKFFTICNKKFKIETALYFGIEMIEILRNVHTAGIVHRDIKPNNFLFGKFCKDRGISDDQVYIIDFGLSARYIDNASKHIPCTSSKFIGTPRYASINTHRGVKQSRRDDLESIAYILIYFIAGDLPWQGVKAKTKSEKKEKIKAIKEKTNFESLEEYKSVPDELKNMLKYCKGLGYDETPNYAQLKLLLKSLQERLKIPEHPKIWEWDDLLLNGQYSQMKKKYRALYEGYPSLQFQDYLKILHNKKKIQDTSNIIKICIDSEVSLVETQCESKSTLNSNQIKDSTKENLERLIQINETT